MTLSLLSYASAMAPKGLTLPFSGIGGVAPYTYSVISGGAGGSINGSTGLYTSPSLTGRDTVQVTDGSAATASKTILIGNALELFCDVIQTGMSLEDGQIYLWDQKIDIPTDSRLYVAVAVLNCKPFGNTNAFVDGDQIQSVNMSADVSVDILSRGPDARDRKEEVILALNSQYSENQQELNSFRIFQLSNSFVNLSEVDGAAIPYRFNITSRIQYFVTKPSAVNYYDTFPADEILTST